MIVNKILSPSYLFLLTLTQVTLIRSDSSLCIDCPKLLNRQQCIYYASIGCQWLSKKCQGSVDVRANVIIGIGIASGSDAGAASATSLACGSNTPSPISLSTPFTGNCALCSGGSCFGYDGVNMDKICAYEGANCIPIDTTQSCDTFDIQEYCEFNQLCHWSQGLSDEQGICGNHVCGDYKSESYCNYVITSSTSAKACKWNTVNATCVDGLATDLSNESCSDGKNLFYTFDEGKYICTECTSHILQYGLLMFIGLNF